MNLPNRVTLELTNRCNRTCEGCPRHKMTYPLGDMSISLLSDIIDQLPPETVIVPFFRGESLLHPRFVDAMEKLKKFKTVQLATNGDGLTSATQKAMLNACSFVSLSLHEVQYPETVKGKDFLHSAKNEGVTTQVSIVETLLPNDKKDMFIQEWLKHVNRVRIYKEHSHNGFGDVAEEIEDDMHACIKPFDEMVVYWDGKVVLCNHDWDSQNPLGNLHIQTIKDVWNGVAYGVVRKFHSEGKRKLIRSCRDCDYWKTSYLKSKMFGELYTN